MSVLIKKQISNTSKDVEHDLLLPCFARQVGLKKAVKMETITSNVAPQWMQTKDRENSNYDRGYHNHGLSDKDSIRLESNFTNRLLADAAHANEIATEKTGAATQIGIERTSAANQLATERTFNAIQSSMALNYSSLLNNQTVGFKDGLITAFQNQAALSQQLAECCCEIKVKIAEDGEKTRALANQINMAELLAKAAVANQENLLLRLKVGTPNIPV